MFIGEWMETRGIRDQIVIATKVSLHYPLCQLKVHDSVQYSFNFKQADPGVTHKINYHGNNAKSMRLSVDASLKKLRTSYIDILYVHVWDLETSVEEVMNNLHNLVVSGKVLYLVTLSFMAVVMFFTDLGRLQYSCLGCCPSQSIRPRSRQDTILRVRRTLEYYEPSH
jgi:aryl-alcohol dehydrogenase-like predicted oxidoreductase